MLGHISHSSMGNDIADINNDGFPDIFTLDMLPEGNKRQKLLMAPDNYEKFEFNLNVGFHYQYMRNMLHLNHGNGTFSEIGQLAGVSNTDWSWAALFADLDNDGLKDLTGNGFPDLVLGNHGLNSQVRVSEDEPAEMHFKDFDDIGAVDPILSFYIEGESYPYVTRDELLDQISKMRTRFGDYASYAEAKLEDIFTEEELTGAGYLRADILRTSLFLNEEGEKLSQMELPSEVQYSPVFSVSSMDADGDGHRDLLLFGNIERARLRFGKYDANKGLLLKGDGQGNFTYVPQRFSGLSVKGDVRSILTDGDLLLLGVNQDGIKAYQISK